MTESHDPSEIERIREVPPESSAAKEAEEAARQEAALFDSKKRALELKLAEQDLKQREQYAERVYWLIVWWLLSILGLTTLHGFRGIHGLLRGKFALSEAIILGLIGGTTVSVIGLFVIVMRNLFPRRDALGDDG